MSLAFQSNAAGVLGVMLRDLMRVEGAVGALRKEFAGLRTVAIGALTAFAGFTVLHGIWDMVKAGNKLNEELNKTAMLGGEFATRLEEIKQAAFRIHFQVPNVAPSEAVHIMREIAPQMQTPEDAIKLGEPMARMAAVLNYFTGQGRDMGGNDALRDVVRTVEMRRRLYKTDPVTGKEGIDLEAFQREATAMERAIILSEGMLKPRDFLLMARQAGPAGMMQDQTTFYALMGELSVAMGSQRAGTALTSLFQQFAGGVMPQRVAREMTRMGILQPGEWHPQRGGGGGVLLDPEATKRLSAAIRNPFEYIQNTLVPQLASQGKKGMDLLTEVFLLFGRSTTQRFVSELAMGGPQWARTMRMFPEVMDPQTAQQFLHSHSLTWSLGELSASWQGLMEVLSEQNVNPFILTVHGLTTAINWLAQEAIAHPTLARWLIDSAIGVAGLAAVLGTLAVVRFLVISGGLASITRALVGLGAAAAAGAGAAATGAGGGMMAGLAAIGAGAIGGAIAALLTAMFMSPEHTKRVPQLEEFRRWWIAPHGHAEAVPSPKPAPPAVFHWSDLFGRLGSLLPSLPHLEFERPASTGSFARIPPVAKPPAVSPPLRHAPAERFAPMPPSGPRVDDPAKGLPPDWQEWAHPGLGHSSHEQPADKAPRIIQILWQADGRTLAQIVLDHAGRVLSGPARGTLGVDPRAIPENPGAWA